ncbi:MAG: T9SS type A sorting domain-containing protein, partial [Calditrichia bacterium]|nr:T9SS type A sorting domain-containing protein [Calditrichia bacterium]
PVYDATMPEEGTIFRLITTKPIATDDEWTFTAPGVSYDADLAEKDVKKVNVFPNPYYAFNSESTSRFDAHVTFNNLPEKATIRIFNLIGEQVKKFDKESSSQFLKWDLKNESGLPVGSGIFIVHIKMPDQNVEKILKLFVIQRAEILEYF